MLIMMITLNACSTTTGTSGGVIIRDENTTVAISFSDREIKLIRDYYAHHRLPPGLAKRSSLPPGLKKQLARRGKLPPGLSKEPLPHDLERRLSPLPDDYIRVRIGADVVLMNKKTRVVVDILKGITL